MNKEKRRVPKLRFPGFTEDWEQRKLKSIANTIVAGGDIDKTKIKEIGTYPVIANALTKEGIVGYYNDDYRIEAPAVTVTGRGDIGVAKARHQNFTPVVRLLSLTTAHDVDFIEHAINNLKIVSESTGVPQLTVPQLSNYKIHITSIIEEQKIGVFISKLDNLITLHQRKLEHLNLKKKALLQKLFPKNGERYPDLRFPGFTDAWEQRKLCQITTRVTRKNGGQSDLPLTISAQDGLVDQRKYFNRQVASRDMSNYYLIKKGEFAYNKSYSEGYPFGAVKRLDYYDIGALSTLYILFEITDNNISSDFIVSYYMTHLWYKEISKRAAEGARNHGLLNISTEDFFDSELNIPNSIEEQVKIGNFIKQFDKFITLHQ